MTSSEGWTPLREPRRASASGPKNGQRPRRSSLGNGLRVTPFTQLARVHALSAVGDGFIAVALAGSIFFSIDPEAARWRVALYLILTIAPFAVVTPLLGPVIDRAKGGRRGMVIGTLAARAVVAFFMVRHIDSLFLFPEAFVMLVLQKGYSVSRTALVPAVCPHDDELIEANSKLALLSSIGGLLGAGTGALIAIIFGGGGTVGVAVVVFLAGAALAIRLPQVQIASQAADSTEKQEVRGANIILAATAVAVMRGIVGFTTFLLAFHLRAGEDGIDRSEPGAAVGAAMGWLEGVDVDGTPGPPSWHFGVAALAAGIGALLGARYAPQLRERVPEERLVLGGLLATTIAAFLGAWGGGITGTAVLAFGVGFSAAIAKLGFDALVQRDAPRANYGRAFAAFEGRFQLMWAAGAFIPVIFPMGIELGALMVAIAAGLAAASYELGRRTDRVQSSSRVRQAIRGRVPDAAVERFGNHPTVLKLKPAVNRIMRFTRRSPLVAERPDPTLVAALPASPGDRVDDPPPPPPATPDLVAEPGEPLWGPEYDPQLSSGSGVWLADPAVETPTEPGDDGQFRLWSSEPD
ncbi:MAG: MFS transporter [Acidimicrobiales bacterium]